MIAAFVALAGASSPNAADFTADQVRQRLASATDGKPADFARKDLSDLDLGHIDFRGADLSGANLFASRLVSCNLAGPRLAGANLNGAWLMGASPVPIFPGARCWDS